jgi:hypothetical protein
MLRQHVVLFFASSLEQSVTIHGCAFPFGKPLEQRVTTHVVLSFRSPLEQHVTTHVVLSFRKPLEQHVTTHVVLSLQLKASMVCDRHSHVSCAGTLCFPSNTAAV